MKNKSQKKINVQSNPNTSTKIEGKKLSQRLMEAPYSKELVGKSFITSLKLKA